MSELEIPDCADQAGQRACDAIPQFWEAGYIEIGQTWAEAAARLVVAAEFRRLAQTLTKEADLADKSASNASYGLRIAACKAMSHADELDPEGITRG